MSKYLNAVKNFLINLNGCWMCKLCGFVSWDYDEFCQHMRDQHSD